MHTTSRIDQLARRPAPAGERSGSDARRRAAARSRLARRPLMASSRGRAWVNGREVGALDPRWAHLSEAYD